MKKIIVIFTMMLALLKIPALTHAQNNVGPWIGEYDANGLPYVWTSVYDDENFWSIQIAFSYHWGMMLAPHIDGSYLKVWQPAFVFDGNYKVKPDEIDDKLMYVTTPSQLNKIINMIDSGDCDITMNCFISGKPYSKSFHYRYYPGTLSQAMDTLLDNEE